MIESPDHRLEGRAFLCVVVRLDTLWLWHLPNGNERGTVSPLTFRR